jgi:hypothetical protein
VDGLLLGDLQIVGEQNLARIGLRVYVNEKVRLPLWSSPAASEILVEVLPVPPFWDAIEMIIVGLNPTGACRRLSERRFSSMI